MSNQVPNVTISEQERILRDAAAVMCSYCAAGDKPEWMPVFQGMTHVWRKGNGHQKCSAGPIWEKLIYPKFHTRI